MKDKDYPFPFEAKMFLNQAREIAMLPEEIKKKYDIPFPVFYKQLLRDALNSGVISKEYHDKRIRKLYRFTHKKHLAEKQNEWDQLNRDKCLERYRRYHKRHKRKISRRNKEYYWCNRDKILEHKRIKRESDNKRLK